MTNSNGARAGLLGLAFLFFLGSVAAQAELIYGVTQQQQLVTWDSADPTNVLSGLAIQGLQPNERVMSIDFRPATGELYALGNFNRLYRVDPSSGLATQVGNPFATPLNGGNFGADFNPVVDRLRVVSNVEQNLRINPNDASVIVDTPLAYKAGDENFGENPNVISVAYTNNFAGATSTQLYGIDTLHDVLVEIESPNGGVLRTVGNFGTDLIELGGFDISGETGVAYLATAQSGFSKSTFWTVNLNTGKLTLIDEIAGGVIIEAITVVPEPSTIGLLLIGGLAGLVRRFR